MRVLHGKVFSHQVTSWALSVPSWRHLMGKTCFPWSKTSFPCSTCIGPKQGNSQPCYFSNVGATYLGIEKDSKKEWPGNKTNRFFCNKHYVRVGWEPWSSGFGKRLMFQRSWVWFLALNTGWTFFTFIFCKNCKACLKRPKINQKEAGVGPLKNIKGALVNLTE